MYLLFQTLHIRALKGSTQSTFGFIPDYALAYISFQKGNSFNNPDLRKPRQRRINSNANAHSTALSDRNAVSYR